MYLSRSNDVAYPLFLPTYTATAAWIDSALSGTSSSKPSATVGRGTDSKG